MAVIATTGHPLRIVDTVASLRVVLANPTSASVSPHYSYYLRQQQQRLVNQSVPSHFQSKVCPDWCCAVVEHSR